MFANKKSILFITKSKARLSIVTLGNKPKETIVGEFDWTHENFLTNLSKYKKSIGKKLSILLIVIIIRQLI